MSANKQNLPTGQLEHIRDNLYKIRYHYKNGYTNRYLYKTNCQICGKEVYQHKTNADRGHLAVCNGNCRSVNTGNKCRKERKYKTNGYVLIYSPNHPYAYKNYNYEHRLVVEEKIKRYLLPEEKVHHINFIKDDNRIENLVVFNSTQEHTNIHRSADDCFKDLINMGIIIFNFENKTYQLKEDNNVRR